MFEEGKYKDFTNKEIQKDLENQGYHPLLITEKPNDHLDAHSHPENHILVVVEGEMKVKVDGKEIIMVPGDKLTIDSQVSHAAFFGSEGCKYLWIEF